MRSPTIHAAIPRKLYDEIRVYAAATNRTPANLLVYAVSQHMRRYPLERARRAKDASEGAGGAGEPYGS